ncbi:hypothetical protein PVP01_0007100 [Plasmodium vivax]|uniref:Uncharacterized protein n=1 Tax=Plasmodium vivax TaxID=5855 RepID=A0A565A7M8_PLAVI|nr:hypothetical protein PVP01_0007100 [Plasmodium vivax]
MYNTLKCNNKALTPPDTPRKCKEKISFINPEIIFCTIVMDCESSFTGSCPFNCCVPIMVTSGVNVLRSSMYPGDLYDLGFPKDSCCTWCCSDRWVFSDLTYYDVPEVAFSYNGALVYVDHANEFSVSSLIFIMLIKPLLYECPDMPVSYNVPPCNYKLPGINDGLEGCDICCYT